MDRRIFLKMLSGAGAACALGCYPVLIEPHIYFVNKYKIHIPRLPKAFEGFTIVQLTDLHFGPLVSYKYLQKVIQRANSIPRDLIVCTGDYIHERNGSNQIDRIWPLISTLKAPYGVYSVLGNHDHWGDTERSLFWLDKSGHGLHHQAKYVEQSGEKLWLVGAGDLWEDHINLDHLCRDIPEADCRIVLAHNPDTADTDFQSHVDLMISGHTHGGQVNIPFIGTPVLPVKNKKYSFGLKASKKGLPVFISRGIGWAIYPVRFNCFPEIAVLELVRAA